MRILHVLKSGNIGGVEKLCLDMAIKCPDYEFLFIKDAGTIPAEIKKVGNKVYTFFPDERLSFRKLKQAKKRMDKMIYYNNYDAVVFHHGSFFLWALARYIKKYFSWLKVFIYIHSDTLPLLINEQSGFRRRRRKLIKAVENCDGIIAISQYVKQEIIKIKPKLEDKIHVIHNGVDLKEFSCKGLKKFHEPIRCIYIGRVTQDKGILNLVVAFNKFQNATLTVVGMGDVIDECQKLANEKISFVGQRANASKLLSTHDVFVHFPLANEGFGISIIEAMAKGLLCITNNKGGLPEILENGVGGIVLNSLSELETTLNNLDEEKTLKLRENALEIAKKYSIENTIENLEKVCSGK